MSKAQHTPGPWTLQRFGVIYGGPFQQYTNGSAQSQIGMATGADFMVEGEREANARLMAAAPDLLAAAVAVLAGLNERIDWAVENRSPTPVFDGIAALHDAISKATE